MAMHPGRCWLKSVPAFIPRSRLAGRQWPCTQLSPRAALPWYPALRAPGRVGPLQCCGCCPRCCSDSRAGGVAAIPSAGLQWWACWHGGRGTDVAALHGRAENLPMEWQVQTQTFPSTNCPVPAQRGPSHCTGCHSSGCPQQQCLTPTVAGGITKWQEKKPTHKFF